MSWRCWFAHHWTAWRKVRPLAHAAPARRQILRSRCELQQTRTL
jgi:hypothetical protein